MLGQEIETYVKNEIVTRQAVSLSNSTKRSNQNVVYLNNQNSWIKVASGIKVLDTPDGIEKLQSIGMSESQIQTYKGDGLAKNFILFNGTSFLPDGWSKLQNRGGFGVDSFLSNGSYSKSSFGIVPMPGIESFDVKSLNRGSIKKASLKLKLHSRQQFDIFELLYLRLGYTVMIEYGNNIFVKNDIEKKDDKANYVNTEITDTYIDNPEGFFSQSPSTSEGEPKSFINLLEEVEALRNRYGGNYDGFLGKIVNFEWSIDELGSYDITLDLISLGDVIESLKVNLPISQRFINFLNNIKKGAEEEECPNLLSAMIYSHKYSAANQSEDLKPVHTYGLLRGPNEEPGILSKGVSAFKALASRFTDYDNSNPLKLGQSGVKMVTQGALTSKNTTIDFYCGPKSFNWKYKDIPKKKVGTKTYTQEEMSAGQPDIDHTAYDAKYLRDGVNASSYRNWYLTDSGYKEDLDEFVEEHTGNVSHYQLWSEESISLDNPSWTLTPEDGFKTTQSPANHYLRFGALLQWIQSNIIPVIKQNDEDKNGNPVITINTNPNYFEAGMYTIPNQISLDPRVCIVRNTVVNPVNHQYNEFYRELQPFREMDFKNEDLSFYNVVSGEFSRPINPNRAYIKNIFLNHKFINKSLSTDKEGKVNLFQFLKNLCDGINVALGGINNLEPIINETTNKLTIADLTSIPAQIDQFPDPPYKLNLFGFSNEGYGNFIRKLDIKTTITPEYATMITVGATSNGYVKGTNGTAFSKWNKGLQDRYKPIISSPDPTYTSNRDLTEEEEESIFLNQLLPDEAATVYYQVFLDTWYECKMGIGEGKGDVYDDTLIERQLSVGSEFYQFALAKKTMDNMGSNSIAGGIGFIPFKMSFTMNGLSGVKIYNTLHVDSSFLPKAYGDTLDFIVTGVDHSIKDNDWETKVSTLVQPKTSQVNSIIIGYNYIFKYLEFHNNKSIYQGDQVPSNVATSRLSSPNPNPQPVERDGDRTKGTIGTVGVKPIAELSPTAKSKEEIDSIVIASEATDPIRKRIVTIAASYIGQNETPGNNSGWHDPLFQDKMTPSTTGNNWGWSQTQAWCDYFTSLVWYEAYTTGNALVGPANSKYTAIFNRSGLTGFDKGAKVESNTDTKGPFGSYVAYTRKYFQRAGKYITIQEAKSGKKLPQPGDMFTTQNSSGQNHIGIVAKVFIKNGKLTQFSTIEGNTGPPKNDPRDGGLTKYRFKFWDMSIVHGFCQVLTS